jgi:hypothetical protein
MVIEQLLSRWRDADRVGYGAVGQVRTVRSSIVSAA